MIDYYFWMILDSYLKYSYCHQNHCWKVLEKILERGTEIHRLLFLFYFLMVMQDASAVGH